MRIRALGAQALVLATVLFGGAAMGSEAASVVDIPKLTGIVIDGDAADWGEHGFQVCMLTPVQGELRPASDFDANCRIGWDERGLLVVVNVHDNVWIEAETGLPFYNSDSVSFSLARKDAGSVEIDISPGMDPRHPEMRFNVNDGRKVKQPEIAYEVKRAKTAFGYTLEALLPWSNFGVAPRPGEEFGFMIVVNDGDPNRGRYSPRWFTAGGHAKGVGMRLAQRASPPSNRVVAGGAYERFRRVLVHVDAVAAFLGKSVTLKSDGQILARMTLQGDGPRASASAMLAMPPPGKPYSGLVASVEGIPDAVAPVLLPDPDEERARALIYADFNFRHHVFSGDSFPPCEFEQPNLIEDLIGAYAVKTTFYDADCNVVTKAEKPGRYGAVVEIKPENGRAFRRFRTLFRTTGRFVETARRSRDRLGPDREADASIPLPHAIGIAPAVAQQHARTLDGLLLRALTDGLGRDARAAQTFVGLFESDPKQGTPGFYDDWPARERQWWVGLKRKLYGLDKEFATPLQRPLAIDGNPAPVLRAGTAAEAGMKPDAVEKIDAVCRQWADDSDQGFAVCLARRGVVFLNKAYGLRGGQPMTPADKSNVASVTKTMAGMLMMMMVDQGLVDLDAPVSRYVPALRGVPTHKPITLRLLYLHRAGFPANLGFVDETPDLEESLAIAFPHLHVDERFEYASTSYGLAGKVLENLTGESLPQFYKKHLLDPLGCTCEAGAMGYGIRSTAMDMAILAQVLLNHGAYGPWRFMSEETFQKMLPPEAAREPGADMSEVRGIGVRYFRIAGLGDRILGHNSGSETILRADLDNQLIIVMTRNQAGRNFNKYDAQFMHAVAEGVAR